MLFLGIPPSPAPGLGPHPSARTPVREDGWRDRSSIPIAARILEDPSLEAPGGADYYRLSAGTGHFLQKCPSDTMVDNILPYSVAHLSLFAA